MNILKTDRRSLLRGSLLGAAVLLLAWQVRPAGLAARPHQLVRREHAGMIAVGRAYLDLAPEESDAARLRQLPHLPAEVSALTLPGRERDRLALRQSEDFRTGEAVLVQRWLLSRTDARLCALAAL